MNPQRWQQVTEAFATVYFDTNAAERETVLRQTCSGDSDLETEVRKMIEEADCPTPGPLDQPTLSQPRAVLNAFRALRLGFEEGQVLCSRFRLVRLLGVGGMGQVWEAYDQDLRVRRAIKTLRPEIARDPMMVEQFKREVEHAQAVTHPHVCRVFDLSNDGETPFLSMQLVEGETLSARLRRGDRLTRKEAYAILGQCGSALDAAHRVGLMHRDFKPSNVMLSKGPDSGIHAVVMDFGLALPIAADTREEKLPGAGAPAYMAPEQTRGEELTPAVDLYAFGVTACEVLAGARPSQGGLAKLKRRERKAIERCLDGNPNNRPESCAKFLDTLWGETSRRRWLQVAAGVAGITILGGTKLAIDWLSPAWRSSIAVLPFECGTPGEDAQALAQAMPDRLVALLSRVPRLRVIPRSSTSRFLQTGRTPAEEAAGIGAHFLLSGTIRSSPNRIHVSVQLADLSSNRTVWAESFDRPEAELQHVEQTVAANTLAQLGFGSLPMKPPIKVHDPEAVRLDRLARYHFNLRTTQSLTLARDTFRKAIARDPNWAAPRVGLTQALLVMSERGDEDPVSALPEARLALDRAFALEPEPDATTLATDAFLVSVHDHDLERALRGFRHALELEPGNATARQWYAIALSKAGKSAPAIAESQIAMELDPLSSGVLLTHAAVLFYARDYPRLLEHTKRIEELEPQGFRVHILRAYAMTRLNRKTEAREQLRLSQADKDRASMVLRMIGEVHALLGEQEAARNVLAALIQKRNQDRSAPPSYIAFLAAALGDTEEAFRWLETAWTERDPYLTFVAAYPSSDLLRNDPRFSSLLLRLGLIERKGLG